IGPSSQILLQSIARRKHTTARPENTPINTASTKKKRSSLVVLRVNQERTLRTRGEATTCGGVSSAAGSSGDVPGAIIDPLQRDPEKQAARPRPDLLGFHISFGFAARFRKPGPSAHPGSCLRPAGATLPASASFAAIESSNRVSQQQQTARSSQFLCSRHNHPGVFPHGEKPIVLADRVPSQKFP